MRLLPLWVTLAEATAAGNASFRHSTDGPVALARWPTLAVVLAIFQSVHIFTVFVPLENRTSRLLPAAVRSKDRFDT